MPDPLLNMSKSVTQDRISIFRGLTVDEISNTTNMELYKELLDIHYKEFIDFCDSIKGEEFKDKSFSCFVEGDNIQFIIN